MVHAFRVPNGHAPLRAGNRGARHNTIRSLIMEYLANNGASRVSDISSAVGSSKDNVRYHLAALEAASLVRSNISPGTRTGFTPFYALTQVSERSRERVL